MPVSRINLSQFINPVTQGPGDITAGLRQWQAQHLDEARLQEQQRQFDQNQARQNSEFSQEQQYKNRVSNDINARFGLELGEKTNLRGYEQESSRYKQQLELLNKARFSASQGRWNEVEAMMGSLKELGANVGRSMDQDGKPIYHLQAGQEPTASGESFESSMAKLNGNQGQSGYQFDASSPQITQQQKSPFDNSLGTTSYQFNANQPTISQQSQHPQQPQQHPTTVDQDLNHIQQELDGQVTIGPQASQQPQQEQQFDPYAINSSQLNQMNEYRLQPLIKGLTESFPNRFQPQIQSFMGGMHGLGYSPEGFLTAMQKPLDTVTHLMGAELNAEGQMARANIGQSGHEDTQSRLLANDASSAAQRVLKEYGIKDAVDNSLNMDKVRTLILSDNRNANAQGIKELIKMVEGSRITDKDVDIAASGYASDWEQAKQRTERVYKDGLTADQKSNFNHMIDMYQTSNKFRIGTASKKLVNYLKKFRTEAERYGAYRELMGSIPDEYLPDEVRNWDPSRDFGGQRAVTNQGGSRSVSVTAPTTDQAVQGAKDLHEEASEFE